MLISLFSMTTWQHRKRQSTRFGSLNEHVCGALYLCNTWPQNNPARLTKRESIWPWICVAVAHWSLSSAKLNVHVQTYYTISMPFLVYAERESCAAYRWQHLLPPVGRSQFYEFKKTLTLIFWTVATIFRCLMRNTQRMYLTMKNTISSDKTCHQSAGRWRSRRMTKGRKIHKKTKNKGRTRKETITQNNVRVAQNTRTATPGNSCWKLSTSPTKNSNVTTKASKSR